MTHNIYYIIYIFHFCLHLLPDPTNHKSPNNPLHPCKTITVAVLYNDPRDKPTQVAIYVIRE